MGEQNKSMTFEELMDNTVAMTGFDDQNAKVINSIEVYDVSDELHNYFATIINRNEDSNFIGGFYNKTAAIIYDTVHKSIRIYNISKDIPVYNLIEEHRCKTLDKLHEKLDKYILKLIKADIHTSKWYDSEFTWSRDPKNVTKTDKLLIDKALDMINEQ